ncbi:hypothetical protein [Sphingobacterium sp.]|uniref:hypothetical protein n=1 Tax=Sphingobacterium sp. TaxID=341027 RepID=UPI0028A214E9|nr:hypothetical protein [Sphingobacterium sp.]
MSDYSYKGKNGIQVKVVTFASMPDYIFSIEQWYDAGGWKGLIKDGSIPLREVNKVIDGIMSPKEFNSLEAWEG